MRDLPEPMTPPDCDLRGYDFMPLFGHRLFNSDFEMQATDAEFRAAIRLWWASWQQCPAASLPDDETALCKLAGLGRDLRKWRKIAAMSLHGFCKCADGRLYHAILANEAKDAYARRVSDRNRKRKWRENKESDPSGHAGQDADRTRDETRTERGQDAGRDADVTADRTGQGQDSKEKNMPDLRSGVPSPLPPQGDLIEPAPVVAVAAKIRAKRGDREEPEGFVEFYAAYPRHDGRAKAAEAFPGAVKAAGGVQALMGYLRAFRFPDEAKRFAPYPATWLNERRWRDTQGVPEPTVGAGGAALSYDPRYWDLEPVDVARLPKPRVGSPEYNAWTMALEGKTWPRPGSTTSARGAI
jgi:hypothetical protein